MAATHPAWGKRREPAVISISLINSAIEDEERQLRLSYKNLIKVENLSSFRSLRELRLDNNSIVRIEGLEHLTELTWLDLSFNKIKCIEGLSSLSKLTDLSLCHNEISSVQGLDGCKSLKCLSLSHNRLSNVRELLTLRKLPALQSLAIAGNPLCEGQNAAAAAAADAIDFRSFCRAFLSLHYLDYQLVTAVDVRAAREGGVSADKIAEIEALVAVAAQGAEKEKAQAALAELRKANLDATELLVEDMFAQDPEFDKLRSAAGVPAAVQEFRRACSSASSVLRDVGLDLYAKITKEKEEVTRKMAGSTQDVDAAIVADLKQWDNHLKRTKKGEPVSSGQSLLGGAELAQEAGACSARSLAAQLKLHEAVLNHIETFENTLSEHKCAKLIAFETYFRAVETQLHSFHGSIKGLVDVALAIVENQKDTESIDDELLALLSDREALALSISNSHQTRLSKLASWESDTKAKEEEICAQLVADTRDAAHNRSRESVFELYLWEQGSIASIRRLSAEM